MQRLSDKWAKSGSVMWHWCSACKKPHSITLMSGEGVTHEWNGSLEKATFSPSVWQQGAKRTICHYTIAEGVIKFDDDCSHSMKGQSVDLPALEKLP